MFVSSNDSLTRSARRGCVLFVLIQAFLACAATRTGATSPAGARQLSPAQMGVAWQVEGDWRANDRKGAIHDGDAIAVGSLLQPAGEGTDQSIVVLLPDSQRVLYECFSAQDCARGFLVPRLMNVPDPFAVKMLAQVRTVLERTGNVAPSPEPLTRRPIPREELVVPLGPENRVEIGGLVKNLPGGRYACSAQRIDTGNAEPLRFAVEKSAALLPLTLPGAGIYRIMIRDNRDMPRIDLLAGVVNADRAAALDKPFGRAKKLLNAWTQVFYGWPVHEFLRAYLEALVLDVRPARTAEPDVAAIDGGAQGGGVTAAPQFSPHAGFVGKDLVVRLQSATAGSTIRYMLDGAQPTLTSLVYQAPIVVKGTGLTIKAFASAPGKRDSPIVTGTFLVDIDTEKGP